MNLKKLSLIMVVGTGIILGRSLLMAKQKMIQVKGSDTMVNLAQILAEEYMARHPEIPIAVLGGGSGTGVSALINGTCDIANSSRELKQKEVSQAWERGVKPRIFVIALDGLSIIVNEGNPIEKLTTSEVGAIYRGEVKNWKAVGGPDKAISLYGRQSNSGTYVFMQEQVLGNRNFSRDVKEMNGSAQIVEGVIQDQGAVGYVGVGYLFDASGKVRKGIKILKISKDASFPAYSPLDKEAVDEGNYPLARPLYQATNGKPGAAVADFIRFETGPEGQKIVEREGFFTVSLAHQEQNEKNFI